MDKSCFRDPSAETLGEFECAICTDICVNPVNLPCDHLFCRHEIAESLRRKAECPTCRAPSTAAQLKPLHRSLQNIYNALQIKCDVDGRCKDKVTIASAAKHKADECPFGKVFCVNEGCPRYDPSGDGLLRKSLPAHRVACKYKLVKCDGCSAMVPAGSSHVLSFSLVTRRAM
jgi:hypothetical protein